MTSRDFILIAGAIRAERDAYVQAAASSAQAGNVTDSLAQAAASVGLERLARRMAELLADDNARFRRTTFLEACGVPATDAGAVLEAARLYVRRLKSPAKKQYAQAVLAVLEEGVPLAAALERVRWPAGASFMACQAVRLELERIAQGGR